MVDALRRDARHALRSLRSRKTFAALSALTIALVVGAAAAVIAVVDATMLRSLPFPEDDRLVQVMQMPPGTTRFSDRNPLNYRVFDRFRSRVGQLEVLEGLWARERVLGGASEPETVTTAAVSPGAFALFGGTPLYGRSFTDDEARLDARVAVLGHGLWQRRFGASPDIVGRTVLIDREPHEIIGVMPASFRPGYVASELWTPLAVTQANFATTSTFIQSVGRLRRGASLPQLRAELDQVMQQIVAEAPQAHTGWTPVVMSLRDAQFGQQRAGLWVLLAAVSALAILAAANLSNLTLAQVMARRSDFALRAAIGGRASDLIRLQIVEVLIVTAAGVAAGLLMGVWMLPLLLALDPTTAQTLGSVRIDWRVQAGAIALSLAISLASGLLPLWRVAKADALGRVVNSGRRAVGSRNDHRLRRMLVAVQTAMAVVLIVVGALLLSALSRASQVDLGLDPSHVMGAQMRLSATAYPTEAARANFITRVLEAIRATSGVVSAGATLNAFIPNFFFQTIVQIEGHPTPDGQAHTVQFRRVSPQYFRTMRIPLLQGRDFTVGDGVDAPQVAIVSKSFADRFWPGEDPIGRRVLRGTRTVTVVGVAGEARDVSYLQPPGPTLYLSYDQNNVTVTPVSLVVRTASDPLALSGAIRAAVLSVDPAQPIDHLTTVDRFLADSLGPQRFRGALLLVVALIGVTIAAVGVYGVTSRAVHERTQELGVRMALGATAVSMVRAVVWDTLRDAAWGLLAGGAVAAIAAAALLRALPDVSRSDAWTAAPAVTVLAFTALLAAIIPARRAASLDPLIALRSD